MDERSELMVKMDIVERKQKWIGIGGSGLWKVCLPYLFDFGGL